MKAFENAQVYVTGKGFVRTNVLFDKTVQAIGDGVEGADVFALPEDARVLPGFLDVHVHGAGGNDVMDATDAALSGMAQTLAKEGTTTFLATTMSNPKENIRNALCAVKAYMDAHKESGARMLGVHLEGPYINCKYAGAQPENAIVAPNVAEFDEYFDLSGRAIKLLTLAPERDGALPFIRHLCDCCVVPTVGHSDATEAQVCDAIAAGAKSVTHTFNAQKGVHHREIGVAGAALLHDEIYSEVIADTIHVSVPALRLLAKCKPADKLVLITDAMRAKGIGNGKSELGGQTVYVKDGEARLEDGTLAGSVLQMNRALYNIINKVGVPVETAIDYATINPAKLLGVEGEYGSIAVGKHADFTVVNADFDVLYTIRDGHVIYDAKKA